jgi:NADPH-dependent glutamate synthase beta subunit-like oxidoreductase
MVKLSIDGVEVSVPEGATLLDAAQQAEIYIPHLCSHPDLPPVEQLKPAGVVYRDSERIDNKKSSPYEGCQLCVVQIDGEKDFQRACSTEVKVGMVVTTDSPELKEFRQERLMALLATHPHACLTCAQKEGCARFPCSMNIPEKERCCPKFGNCEFQRLVEYVGIKPETPRYVFEDQPVIKEPLFERDYNLCIGCTRCVRACKELRGIEAIDFVFDDEGRVVIGSTGPTLRKSACRFCTACVEVCPTGALIDTKPFEEVPCSKACPAGIDVPRYLRLIKEGKYPEAVAVIREKVPFPAVLGYICLHFCEEECRRGDINQAIAIRALKRFAAENDSGLWKQRSKKLPASGQKVAVIGSGPAGLTAAYYLAKLGHSVTVFEALPVVGGMMRVGIPRHRLPLEVLDREIEEIKGAGITIKTDTKIESVAKLFDDGYKAVLVAVGAHLGQKLPIHGADLEGILINTDFLRDVSLGKEVKVGEKVVVLGGGNVAFDCARTALRLGAKDVHIACLEDAEKMLATPDECGWGGEEGITVHNSQTFTKILGENGKVSGVECLDVKSFGFDKEGKLNVETVPGSEHVLPSDTIIFAIGQLPELKLTEGVGEIKTTQKRTLEVNEETMATGQASVFAAGDAVTGTTSVIEAIAAGRKAASSIDKYLGGQGDIEETLLEPEAPNPHLGREESFADEKRITVPCLPLQKRLESFDTVELGLGKEEATNEAGRCLRCDLRLTFHKPTLAPKEELWVELSAENISQCPEKEGVYQLLDKDKNVIYIKGATNLRQALEEQLQSNAKAAFFLHEAEPMYTKRESELLQQYMAQHGQMPEGNRELDDLF